MNTRIVGAAWCVWMISAASAASGQSATGVPAPSGSGDRVRSDSVADASGADVDAAEILVPAASSDWHFKLTPYLWVPAQEGDIAIDGQKAPVDLSVGDTFDTITDNFNFAVTVRGEATKGPWTLIGDIMYLSLATEDVQFSSDRADVRQDQGIFELAASYAVIDRPISGWDGGSFRLEPLAGVRVRVLTAEIEPENSDDLSRDRAWADGIVGMRSRLAFNDRVAVMARGDVGLGGSDFTWNALAGVEVGLTQGISVLAGYRALDTDYSDGHGDDRFSYDVLMHGPFMAVEFRF